MEYSDEKFFKICSFFIFVRIIYILNIKKTPLKSFDSRLRFQNIFIVSNNPKLKNLMILKI